MSANDSGWEKVKLGDVLVNADTGEVIAEMTPEEARTLTDRLRTSLGVTWDLMSQAYNGRAWAALGHPSWDVYCATEFPNARLRLPREERDEVIESLRAAGLSIRAIAATGVASKKTVERTIAASGVAKDDTSTESAAVRAARERREREAAEAADPVDFGKCTAGFDCAAKATTDDRMCAWHRGKLAADKASNDSEAGEADAQGPVQNDEAASPADVDAGPTGDGGQAEPPSAPPVLPDDWRTQLANAAYLLRLDPEQVAAAASVDDDADLCALTVWCFRYVQAKEQNA